MVFDLDGTLTRHDTFLPFVGGLLLRTPRRWWRTPGLLWLFVQYGMRRLDRGEGGDTASFAAILVFEVQVLVLVLALAAKLAATMPPD